MMVASRNKIITYLLIAVGIYLFLCAYLFIYQKNFIYFPRNGLNENTRKIFKDFELNMKSGSTKLHGWLLHPNNKNLIIYYGGNGEDVSQNLLDFNEKFKGSSVLLMNYRGYGLSRGKPSEKVLFEDALHIYDEILKNTSYQKIIMMGRSLGSGVATYVASKRKANRIVLITPFDSLANVAQSKLPFFPIHLLLKDHYDSLEYSKEIEVPKYMLVAEKDLIINPSHAKKLYDSWETKKFYKEIKNTTHNNIQSNGEYWKTLNAYTNFTIE